MPNNPARLDTRIFDGRLLQDFHVQRTVRHGWVRRVENFDGCRILFRTIGERLAGREVMENLSRESGRFRIRKLLFLRKVRCLPHLLFQRSHVKNEWIFKLTAAGNLISDGTYQLCFFCRLMSIKLIAKQGCTKSIDVAGVYENEQLDPWSVHRSQLETG